MIIAIASGKGGTGKTTVSASLAAVLSPPAIAVDLDVEEPNLHLFLKPEITGQEPAYMDVPKVDETGCTHCRACSDICQFKAISVLGEVILTFPEMCHGCGACMAVCPENVISYDRRPLGDILWGRADGTEFLMGRLRVGEAMSPPLMRQVKARLRDRLAETGADAIIDAPPGVSCPAVNAVMDADVIVLVTEPTPFGCYDLALAHEAFKTIDKPMGVVINRAGLGEDAIYAQCREAGLPILAEIPYERAVAQAYSQGRIISETSDRFKGVFTDLAGKIKDLAVSNVVRKEAAHA
jgi:MinD superfamily P-loop ATPase